MKKFIVILIVAIMGITLISCKKTSGYIGHEESDQCENVQNQDTELAGIYSPLYFNTEADLIQAITEVQSGTDKDVLTIDSTILGKQMYNRFEDLFELASIDKLYAPTTVFDSASLVYIRANRDYVAYCYGDKTGKETANFVWLRNIAPEVAMNGLEGRGAKIRKINDEGIEYTILEWPSHETGSVAGYSIHWIANGVAYQANIEYGYSDAEMIDFCKIKDVTIR